MSEVITAVEAPKIKKCEEKGIPSEQTEQTVVKKVYKKPELRKYTQIDYVTAYGVD